MKFNLKSLTLLLLVLILTNVVFSQYWQHAINSNHPENKNFYTIQKAFCTAADGKDIKTLNGYKIFKRWEWYMQGRVNSNGQFPVKTFMSEYEKLMDIRKKTFTKNINWSPVGPFNIPELINYNVRIGVGRIDCIAFHPTNENILWVGAPAGGIWKTEDGCETWYPLSDNLPVISISDILINPVNPEIIYIATGERDAWTTFSIGILKSENGGLNWDTTGLNYQAYDLEGVYKMLMSPNDTETIFAGTRNGIYKTVDGGVSWYKVLNAVDIKDMKFNPGNPEVIYASSFNIAGGAMIYKSENGGESFFNLQDTGIPFAQICRITLGTTPANPNIIYALCCSQTHFGMEGLYRSLDEGVTWEQTISGEQKDLVGYTTNGNIEGGQGYYNLSLAISPTNPDEILVGGTHIWKSIDGGFNFTFNDNGWQPSTYWIHGDQHEFTYNPINNNLYCGNDGGIYRTIDGGENWTDLSKGLQILQSYRIGLSATDENLIISGNQDNGSFKFNDDSCIAVFGGDGMECIVNYNDPEIIFTSIQFGDIYRSLNAGQNFTNIKPFGAAQGEWCTPYSMHPEDPNTLYAGYQEVYKTTNMGDTWEKLTTDLTGPNPLECLEVAPSEDNYIYAATYFKIWRTQDGGLTWTDITDGLPLHDYPPVPLELLTFYDIAISSTDPNTLWVTFSNFEEGEKVYKSSNGGDSWINVSNNLPNFPVNCIVHQFGTNDGVYVGTDAGVFYTDNDLNAWFDVSSGLPNVVVTELEIQYSANKLVAGTYGRGLWESELFDPITFIDELDNISSFKIFPNPTKGKVKIELETNQPIDISIKIINEGGQCVFSKYLNQLDRKYLIDIDFREHAKGVYIIQLINNIYIISKKIIYK